MRLNGWPINRQDGTKILELSREGCKSDDANACNNLGVIHYRGHGLKRASPPLALTYFRHGCKLGNDTACKNMRTLQ